MSAGKLACELGETTLPSDVAAQVLGYDAMMPWRDVFGVESEQNCEKNSELVTQCATGVDKSQSTCQDDEQFAVNLDPAGAVSRHVFCRLVHTPHSQVWKCVLCIRHVPIATAVCSA